MAEPEVAWVVREFARGRAQTDIARELGHVAPTICSQIKRFCDRWSGHDVYRLQAYGDERRYYARIALKRYPGSINKPGPHSAVPSDPVYSEAVHEYAWLLRAEGVTFREISERLGLSKERIRQCVSKFSRRMIRATRFAHFTVYPGQTEVVRDWLRL